MVEIILLAVASAVFPTLLACVAIIISRPQPRWLLVAFYAGGVIASLVSGFVLLSLFNGGDSALGSTNTTPHPGRVDHGRCGRARVRVADGPRAGEGDS